MIASIRDVAEFVGFIPVSAFAAFTTAAVFSGTMKAAEWVLDHVGHPTART